MTEPYAGINKVPKGKHRATPQEAMTMKQIRYYGTHEIDPTKFEDKTKKLRELKKEHTKLLQKIIVNNLRIKKAEKTIGELNVKIRRANEGKSKLTSGDTRDLKTLHKDFDDIEEKLRKMLVTRTELRERRINLEKDIKELEESMKNN